MRVVLTQVKRESEKCSQLNDIVTQLVADVEQHKGTLSQMNTSVDHLSQVVPRYKSILEEMNLKIEILEVKSSTGVYIWKVNELGRQYCDDILLWPFCRRVTLSLINQNNSLSAVRLQSYASSSQILKAAASRSRRMHSILLLGSQNLLSCTS